MKYNISKNVRRSIKFCIIEINNENKKKNDKTKPERKKKLYQEKHFFFSYDCNLKIEGVYIIIVGKLMTYYIVCL